MPRDESHEPHAMEYMSRTQLKSRSQSGSTGTLEERRDLSFIIEDVSLQRVLLLFRVEAPLQDDPGEDEVPKDAMRGSAVSSQVR